MGLGGRRRGARETPIPLTTIDLCKPGDLALVNRVVVNGWDARQHICDQICDQLDAAMQSYTTAAKTHPTPSAGFAPRVTSSSS
jgi:hypothetical protein